MRATSWIPVAFLALALTLAACSGSAVKEGSGSGTDVVVPSDGEPSTGAFLRTRLASDEVPACFATEVTCELVREDGTTVTLSNTTVSAEPSEGIVIDDHTITGDVAGSYVVSPVRRRRAGASTPLRPR